jgi:hypothetical protein
MLFGAAVFKGSRLSLPVVRITMIASGVLSIAGLLFLSLGNIQFRMIGILGYAGLAPVVFLLLAKVFAKVEEHLDDAGGLSPESGPNNGSVHLQVYVKAGLYKDQYTVLCSQCGSMRRGLPTQSGEADHDPRCTQKRSTNENYCHRRTFPGLRVQ